MSSETKSLLQAMTPSRRKQVEQIMLRYASQSPAPGILPSELEPVYREVIHAVNFQAFFPDNQAPAVRTWEQAQHYLHYVTPQFGY